ncbi:MAG: histidine triad nucleotide-binding protein [Clostridia bacterium]|nr:histidine triad nucleotide-binding protein [Clostridia bacterium]
MDNCIFCKIINREIPSSIVFEDEYCLGFKDVDPQAPFHVLFVPKKHIQDITHVTKEDRVYIDHILDAINSVASENGLDKDGFRIVINTGKDGGQTVPHLHFHVLGKRALDWPPG